MARNRVFVFSALLVRLLPAHLLSLGVVFGMLVAGGSVFLATSQPYLGWQLGTHHDGVEVQRVDKGPAKTAGLAAGMQLRGVAVGEEAPFLLEPLDLTIEPDGAMGTYTRYAHFLQRQGALAQRQAMPKLRVITADNRAYEIAPAARRPVLSLPAVFWVQPVVGVVAWLVAVTVVAFRRTSRAAWYLLASGFCTLLFTSAAAVYSTRELALSEGLFRWLGELNFFGGTMFIASFVAVLLHYPQRLGPKWLAPAVLGAFLLWYLFQELGVFSSMTFARRFHVVMGMLGSFVLAGMHWVRTRQDPLGRAALQYFLLAWMLGTCMFCLFVLAPQLVGIDTSAVQGYAFLLFLLVYAGLAFGILRYRLFDLGLWWRGAVLWSLAMVLLVAGDLIFMFGIGLSAGLSLSLALAVCGVLWLPLRGWLWSRFTIAPGAQSSQDVGKILQVALTRNESERNRAWASFLQETFAPLENEVADRSLGHIHEICLLENGLGLYLPPLEKLEARLLRLAQQGRRLFTGRDLALLRSSCALLNHALAGRSAYDRGVQEERTRLARDLHDHTGSHLLAALHSKDMARKNDKIRETLSDLHDLIHNLPAGHHSLPAVFASLRMETEERFEAAGIGLKWKVGGGGEESKIHDATLLHTLRAIIREGTSNIIRHAQATYATIDLTLHAHQVRLEIADDGIGFDPAQVPPQGHHGLANLRARVAGQRGIFELVTQKSDPSGTRMIVHLDLPKE